jgi:hypothetical protein
VFALAVSLFCKKDLKDIPSGEALGKIDNSETQKEEEEWKSKFSRSTDWL